MRFLGKVLVGTFLGFPLGVLSRTLPDGFHLEPFGVLPPEQRLEPLKVLGRTFLAKRVRTTSRNEVFLGKFPGNFWESFRLGKLPETDATVTRKVAGD